MYNIQQFNASTSCFSFYFIHSLNVYKIIENYKQNCSFKVNSSPAMLIIVNQYVDPVPWNQL